MGIVGVFEGFGASGFQVFEGLWVFLGFKDFGRLGFRGLLDSFFFWFLRSRGYGGNWVWGGVEMESQIGGKKRKKNGLPKAYPFLHYGR